MKIHRNKIILVTFMFQILVLASAIAIPYTVSANGRTVILSMRGYDPYDALRGRYLRLRNLHNDVVLEAGSVERYADAGSSKDQIPVYVVLDTDSADGLSRFAYATLDRPDSQLTYIKCPSAYMWQGDGETRVTILPRIEKYYLNEEHANELDHSINSESDIRLAVKVWHGMYVVDRLVIDGNAY